MAVLVIGFVILFHELGHFIAARTLGIPVKIFSIGFGPKLWAFKAKETEYRLSLIPLGGYVLPDFEDEASYLALPVIKRVLLALGGPLASIALPILCFAAAGVISRGIGLEAIFFKPFYQTFSLFSKIVVSLASIFTGHNHLSGIIGVVNQGGRFIGTDVLKALQFTGLMSLNLAVLNLIPLPALDGGKALLCAMEWVHPRMAKLHYPLAIAGWIIVIGLMFYTTIIDVGSLFRIS